jgi:hypothetical protein
MTDQPNHPEGNTNEPMGLKQILIDATSRIGAIRADLNRLPYDRDTWEQITVAGKREVLVDTGCHLQQASDNLRSISDVLERIAVPNPDAQAVSE